MVINIGDWLLMKLGAGILAGTKSGGSLCSSGDAVLWHSVHCGSLDGFHDGVGHKLNLCNKTSHVSVASTPPHASQGNTQYSTSVLGHLNI